MQYSQFSLKFSFDAQGHIMSKPDEFSKLMYAEDDLQSSLLLLYTNIVKKGRTRTIILLTSPAGIQTYSSAIMRLMSCNSVNQGQLSTITEYGKCFPFLSFIFAGESSTSVLGTASAMCTDRQRVAGVEKGKKNLNDFTPQKICTFDLIK